MSTNPCLKLLLTPQFDTTSAADGLSVTYTIQSPSAKAGYTLFVFKDKGQDGQPSHRFDKDDIVVFDDTGPFDFAFVQLPSHAQEWRVPRDTVGDVVLQLKVKPLPEDICSDGISMAPLAARSGMKPLQCNQGGLIGCGRWFLPQLVESGGGSTRFRNIVEWDLRGSPEGTRAVCSFGESPYTVSRDGNVETLLETVFMVGPIRSYPPVLSSGPDGPEKTSSFGGTYWFGQLPANIDAVAEYATKIFPRMSDFFRDQDGSYRVFLQKVRRGFAGYGYAGGSIIEYDESSKDVSDWELVRLFNHQMVYSWNRLDPDEEGKEVVWFNRGFAMLYSVFLPFRFGQRSPDYFLATVNAFLSAYFTNPHINKPITSSSGPGGSQLYDTSMQYLRGFVFALKMDTYTRRASKSSNAGVLRPIDGIIADMSVRRRSGEKVTASEFLAAVSRWLGEETAGQYFEAMLSGKVIDLEDMRSSFGDKHGPLPFEQEILDFGFNFSENHEDSVGGDFVVTGVVAGSRADQAGLRNGDKVVDGSGMVPCLTDFERRLRLRVERGDERLEIEYWPRSWSKAVSWQVVERQPQ